MFLTVPEFAAQRKLSRSRGYEIAKELLRLGVACRYGRSVRVNLDRLRELEAKGGIPDAPRRRRRTSAA